MKIELANPDRVSMCFVGKYLFTHENPAHIVDVSNLSNQEKQQLFFSIQRGVLKTTDRNKLQSLILKPKQPEQPKTEEIVQLSPREENEAMLTKLLNKSAVSIKKEAVDLRLGQIRRILEIESKNKKRKTLIKFFNQLIDKHQKEVLAKFKNEEMDIQLPDIEENPQVSKIEESEIEERTVQIPD